MSSSKVTQDAFMPLKQVDSINKRLFDGDIGPPEIVIFHVAD
jgi:hypothetical protein